MRETKIRKKDFFCYLRVKKKAVIKQDIFSILIDIRELFIKVGIENS